MIGENKKILPGTGSRKISFACEKDGEIHVTCRNAALNAVKTPLADGVEGIYQISRIVQLDPETAGFFVNIRQSCARACDLEQGSDFCFTRDPELRRFEGFQALTRADVTAPFDNGQKFLMVSYPLFAAFVPLGALLEDGTPHPHGGTGFAVGLKMGRPCDDHGVCKSYTDPLEEDCCDQVEFLQLAWNGRDLSVTDRACKTFSHKKGTFKQSISPQPPLAGVVADGEDLLTGLTQNVNNEPLGRAGVCRWKRRKGRWEIAAFTPVGAPGSFEPSLIRDIDGSLLFTHRAAVPQWTPALKLMPEALEDARHNRDLRVWRSRDNGKTWHLCIHQKDCCNAAPVSLAMTCGGVPLLLTNEGADTLNSGETFFHGGIREKMKYWPLATAGDRLLEGHIFRDANAEFGPPPYGKAWYMDHPVSSIVRLSDRKWHSVLTLRNMDISEGGGGKAPTPFTGLYVEEISGGKNDIEPPWHFAEG